MFAQHKICLGREGWPTHWPGRAAPPLGESGWINCKRDTKSTKQNDYWILFSVFFVCFSLLINSPWDNFLFYFFNYFPNFREPKMADSPTWESEWYRASLCSPLLVYETTLHLPTARLCGFGRCHRRINPMGGGLVLLGERPQEYPCHQLKIGSLDLTWLDPTVAESEAVFGYFILDLTWLDPKGAEPGAAFRF